MIRLSRITEDTVLSHNSHAIYPGAHCAFFGVAGMVPLIKDSYALMVGPTVCLYNAKLMINLRSLTSEPRPDNLLLLPISQEDVIFGAREKVRQGIIEADRQYHPKVLFVVTTCVQEIIGEDFDLFVEEVRPEVNATLLVVHTDNFTCEDASPGIERTYLALSELMQPQNVVPGSVNFLGLRAPGGRKTEPARLLEKNGIKINNVIPSYSTPEDISRAPESSLNIVLEHFALPLAQKMARQFATPYLFCERPYTPDAIEAWYCQIADRLGIDIDRDIRRLKEETKACMKERAATLEGSTFILGMQQGRTFDIAQFLIQMGMTPLLIYVNRIHSHDYEDIASLLSCGVDPFVMKSGDALRSDEILNELKPDYFIGHGDRRTLASFGVKSRSLIRVYDFPGFEGSHQAAQLLEMPLTGDGVLNYKEQYIASSKGV